jgi:fluoride exporter
MTRIILIVAAGSALGGVARFLVGRWVHETFQISFPLGTLIINVTGSFLIGIFYAWAVKGTISEETRLMLTAGFCGGFTTFSTFAWENLELLRNGHALQALTYSLASVVLGIGAAILAVNLFGK